MRDGMTLIETLISLILATIGIIIMFEAFRAYVYNRSVAVLYEKAYIDMNTAYEIGKKIVDEGVESVRDATPEYHIDIVEEDSQYNGCDVYEVIPDSSEINSLLKVLNIGTKKKQFGFKVLDCHQH